MKGLISTFKRHRTLALFAAVTLAILVALYLRGKQKGAQASQTGDAQKNAPLINGGTVNSTEATLFGPNPFDSFVG